MSCTTSGFNKVLSIAQICSIIPLLFSLISFALFYRKRVLGNPQQMNFI